MRLFNKGEEAGGVSQGRRHPLLAGYYWILLFLGWITITILPLGAQDSYSAALSLFWDGRRLEMAETRKAESQLAFQRSLAMTERLLSKEPSNPDLQTLKTWNLFRLHRYVDTVVYAQSVLNTREDHRVLETMAEALFFLNKNEEALSAFGRYFTIAPENDDRRSSAFYYVGEIYFRIKKYEHADIAFSTAVSMEKNMYYWWYRLGLVKEILGQYRRAYEAFNTSLSLKSNFKPALEARERVKAKSSL
jgi:tetratricopeptide (TPR) repeat protein